jgi:hypothetical protein
MKGQNMAASNDEDILLESGTNLMEFPRNQCFKHALSKECSKNNFPFYL